MIDGVKIKNLKVFPDERGRVIEILNTNDELFTKFARVIMTTVYPNIIKAWHYHEKTIDNFTAIKGMIKLVVYDSREDSPTKGEINEFFIGEHNPLLVQIPTKVPHGFKGIGIEEAIVIGICTELHDPKNPDQINIDPHSNNIPYKWAVKER